MSFTMVDSEESLQAAAFIRSLGFKLMAGVPAYRAGILAAEADGLAESFQDELYPVDAGAVLGRLRERASWHPVRRSRRLRHLRAMEATALLAHVEALLEPGVYTRLYADAWFHAKFDGRTKRDLLVDVDRRYGSHRSVTALGGLLWLCENAAVLPVRDDAVVSAGLMLRMTDFFSHYRAVMG